MANILVRSPRFETFTMGGSQNSIKLELYIGGVLRYTIIKNAAPSSFVTFEIAELIRDYISQTFTGGQTQPVTVSTASSNVKQYTGQNGTGTEGSPTAITHTAFNGYGTFMEGANPTLANDSIWLISKDVIKDGYYVYAPIGSSGWISQITAGGTPTQAGFNSATTSLTVGTTDVNIVRIDCTKYGDGKKMNSRIVDKFGGSKYRPLVARRVRYHCATALRYRCATPALPPALPPLPDSRKNRGTGYGFSFFAA